jgi:hypothetical protein
MSIPRNLYENVMKIVVRMSDVVALRHVSTRMRQRVREFYGAFEASTGGPTRWSRGEGRCCAGSTGGEASGPRAGSSSSTTAMVTTSLVSG